MPVIARGSQKSNARTKKREGKETEICRRRTFDSMLKQMTSGVRLASLGHPFEARMGEPSREGETVKDASLPPLAHVEAYWVLPRAREVKRQGGAGEGRAA